MVSHSERDISREAELLYRKVLAIRDQLKESEGGKGSSIYADALTGLSNALSKQGGERREEAVAIRASFCVLCSMIIYIHSAVNTHMYIMTIRNDHY